MENTSPALQRQLQPRKNTLCVALSIDMTGTDTQVELLTGAYIIEDVKGYRKAESLLPSLDSWDLAQLSDIH